MNTTRKKRWLIPTTVLLLVIIGSGGTWYWFNQDKALYPKDVMDRARELHDRILSFDSHITVPMDFHTEETEANRDGPYQFDLVKAASGRLSGGALTIFGWPEIWSGANAPHRPTPGMKEQARHQQEVRYKIITNIVRDHPNQAGIAYTPDDFRRLAHEGKFAIFISMVNAYPLQDDLTELDRWSARGMRMFALSYVGNNSWADSSRPMPFFNDMPDQFNGLSDLGKQAVNRLNDLGVIIDVSQMSTNALVDVKENTRAPIVASHSAVRAIVDIPRNLSDKELQLIKETDGVVQIVAFPAYVRPLSQATRDKLNNLRNEFGLQPLDNLANALMPGDPVIAIWPEEKFGKYASTLYAILEEEPKATIADLCDAIDYAVKKIGVDHVGISSDFNDGGGVVGWSNVSEIRNVTAELITRGYSDADIAKLWSGNFLRVWEKVQAAAVANNAGKTVEKPLADHASR